MKKATVSQLKNRLSHFLRAVKQGEPVIVLDRGRPIAELYPLSRARTHSADRLQALAAAGVIRQGDPAKAKGFPFPPPGQPTGAVDALIDERRSGR